MPYPKPPWTLQGDAIQTLHLVNIDRVRHLIPSELDIISVWPGKTLGSVYLSNYQSGSVLEYSELIIAPSLVIYRGKTGAWISHIYVDNVDSVAGGREIWGLPKELAEFTWKEAEGVIVCQGERHLCSLNYKHPSWAWRQRLGLSSFSAMAADLLLFSAEFESRLGLINSQLQVPLESPFAEIDLDQPFLTVSCDDLRLRVSAPQVVGVRSD